MLKQPMSAENTIIIENIIFLEEERIYRGIIFCQVDKIVNLSHVKPSLTWGNQKNKGKSPNFIVIARTIRFLFIVSQLNFCDTAIDIINKDLANA